MSLTYQDIQAILRILDDSPYDELRLDDVNYSLYLKRSADGWTQEQHTLKAVAPLTDESRTTAAKIDTATSSTRTTEPTASESGLVDVRSPIVGTFYRAPQPGSAPFVEIGSTVEPDTVIAIVEVMKLMSSIPALAHGVVREIIAQDAQFVEKGQLLMRVKP